jgi:AraC-like DNA-binding protein
VLKVQRLLDQEGLTITNVACRLPAGRGHADEAAHHAIVFVRNGCFVRSADGASHLLDPTQAYCINPGAEHRYDHPHAHGDDCTSVRLDPTLLASLWGGYPTLPSTPFRSSPAIDLQHRLVLAAAGRGDPPDELYERTVTLVADALAPLDPGRIASGRPATMRARRVLVDAVREALAADPDRSLADLATELDVSAYHLSRIFRSGTGHTIARHRMRLRTRAALERLAAGDHHLAHLAADLGFSDQSHLTRVIRTETGHTPSALRSALSSAPAPEGLSRADLSPTGATRHSSRRAGGGRY